MADDPLAVYLAEIANVRASGAGVPETSYYPALSNLLNDVGKGLKPRVRAVINLKNRGAGLPDGGLFTADQIQSGPAPLQGQLPARGAIEIKSSSADAKAVAADTQVARYLAKYRQVLVTNLWEFILIGADTNGAPIMLETYRLATSERAFWKAASGSSKKLPSEHGKPFLEFLKRALLHAAALVEAEGLAWFLASYALKDVIRVERQLPLARAEALDLAVRHHRGFPDVTGVQQAERTHHQPTAPGSDSRCRSPEGALSGIDGGRAGQAAPAERRR